jgi:E3 ubiquitin-protein ligase HUWE1
MALDSMPEIDRLIGDPIGEALLGDLAERSSVDSMDDDGDIASEHSAPSAPSAPAPESIAAPGETVPSSSSAPEPEGRGRVTKDELDEERAKLREDLIDRCLDVIRAHPESVFEVSELIQTTLLKPVDDNEKRAEVGDLLSNALLSFSDDDVKKSSGASIAAYAHLLALLLQDKAFYKATVGNLKENITEYLNFLRLSPASSSEDLPPWIPYVLLVFEIMLSDDEQPVEVRWKVPTSKDDTVEEPQWVEREPNIDTEDRSSLLDAVLDILPRIGKEGPLAISIARILVILTRDRSIAKALGEKKNLQRLFVMAKQLCGAESGHLKDSRVSRSILIILRHIIEDEDTIRQLMQAEIRTYMENNPSRGTRSPDIPGYIRHFTHLALRSPKIFIDVTTEMVKLTRWAHSPGEDPLRQVTLTLKEPNVPALAAPPKDASVEPAVQATEDLTINDVKPSTEPVGREAPRTPGQELKRPIIENPDGVIHFLLCELLNYKEVEDKDSSQQPAKEAKTAVDPSTPSSTGEASAEHRSEDGKDKKAPKPVFRAEEHPIFVYRCFLLHCLAELLQSYNRTKVEFINFKRSAPIQTNTPIKPRASVLNYLLNDVLCSGISITSLDTVALKKRAATANQVQLVLVALTAKTGEKPMDRGRGAYEYDDEPDLLFVRRFVLDTVLKAYKEAATPTEAFDIRYAKMVCLAELMSQMIGEKDKDPPNPRGSDPSTARSQAQLKRLMYEKGYLGALTASIADIDLTFPNVKRTIKYILRALRILSKTAIQLSQSNLITSASTDTDNAEDEIASASSLSDMDDDREETPDLYRNSALGMLESGRGDDFSEESEDGNDYSQPSTNPNPNVLT